MIHLQDDKPSGVRNENIFDDWQRYEIVYVDGMEDTSPFNIIAEDLLYQVGEQVNKHIMLDKVIDHRILPNDVPISDSYYENKNGFKKYKRNT